MGDGPWQAVTQGNQLTDRTAYQELQHLKVHIIWNTCYPLLYIPKVPIKSTYIHHGFPIFECRIMLEPYHHHIITMLDQALQPFPAQRQQAGGNATAQGQKGFVCGGQQRLLGGT